MPDFDFDAFNHDNAHDTEEGMSNAATSATEDEAPVAGFANLGAIGAETSIPEVNEPASKADESANTSGHSGSNHTEEVDKW